jgi:hypothetical protein
VFEYLVTSKTRRNLLVTLWRDRARGTVSSLARQSGVPLAASYGELQAMSRAGLARESLESGRLVYEAERNSPCAGALQQLVCAAPSPPAPAKPELDARWDAVRTELAVHGAPLWARLPDVATSTPLEVLLAKACELSHHDPSVAKVLPYLFLRKKNELDFERLERALAENKQKHTAGFLLALAGALARDPTLRAWAGRLRDKRRTKPVDFFAAATSTRLRELAERNSPQLARAWNFRLNMKLDDFRSVMEKFPVDDHVPS